MPEWLWAVLIGGVILALVAYIWRMHENHDQERNRDVWNQIGRNSNEGMRKIVHECANRLSEVSLTSRDYERRIARIERFLNGKLRQHEDDR
jgi:hypothetical protein